MATDCDLLTDTDSIDRCEDLVGTGIGTKSFVGSLLESIVENGLILAVVGALAVGLVIGTRKLLRNFLPSMGRA